MNRAQIYLTDNEVDGLGRLSSSFGKKKSEIIRQAIDEFLARQGIGDPLSRLRAARGMWEGRKDVPDIAKLRAEFDRF